MPVMTAPGFAARPAWLPKFKARAFQSVDDSGLDTNEELDNSETDITMDADASSILAAGDVIHIEAEDMQVVSVSTVTVTVVRGYAGSSAVTHVTNTDVFLTNTASTTLWLPGQDDPQSSTIRDRSGFGNDGTITGATWVRNSKGLWGLDYDGADDSTSVASSTSITDIWDGGGTLLVWVNADTVGENLQGTIANKSSDTWLVAKRQEAAGKVKLRFFISFDVSAGTWDTSATVLTLGTSQLVAITYDADNVANDPLIYIDGVVKGTSDTQPVGTRVSDAGSALIIGSSTAGDRTFDGTEYLFRLVTTILTATQIDGIYQQERGLFGV